MVTMSKLYNGHVLVVVLCLLMSSVNGDPALCSNPMAWANVLFYKGIGNTKSYDEMYVMSHGTESNKKCKYMKRFIQQLGYGNLCDGALSTTCSNKTADRPKSLGPDLVTLDNEPFVCPLAIPKCNPTSMYRTIDGSCNNLAHPHWGMALTAQRRHMGNAYDDGKGSPRTKGCFGPLPSARHVSNVIHASRKQIQFEAKLSYMFVQVGQFLSHDFVETKLFTQNANHSDFQYYCIPDIECIFYRDTIHNTRCRLVNGTNYKMALHQYFSTYIGDDGEPLLCCTEDRNHSQCNPIKVPGYDETFATAGCINFARSNSLIDCSFTREPINSQTSYLDLSMVYAPTDEESKTLRSFVGGKMKTVLNKLPVDFADKTCSLDVPIDPKTYYCPLAGDGRVNEQPGLASVHTLLVREHNRLADGLRKVNPHWKDQRLFEEARKINIGQWQHILYHEYLPLILNERFMTKYGLHVKPKGYQDFYNPTTDASVTNAFAVAVFRFGHSQIHALIGMLNKHSKHVLSPQPLEKHFFDPAWYHSFNHSGLDHVLRWSSSERCPFSDRVVEDSVRQTLFLDGKMESSDLISLNIHRGRDHGTPSYTAFRRWCNLSPVIHFGTGPGGLVDHDKTTAALLKHTYSCTDDIDLFTGFMSERRSQGSLLGPTGQCILAAEFQQVRNGDRFFYERRDPIHPYIGFTKAQLNSIKHVKMSTILCQNTHTARLQPKAFLRPNIRKSSWLGNVPIDCNVWKGVDFNLWKEAPSVIRKAPPYWNIG